MALNLRCDILIVGGGTGGTAAALAASSLGFSVILTEETDWIGGQLTSQAVPPDEHPWIESFGCTRRYREFREHVRAFYRLKKPLTPLARSNRWLNPGGGWVSRLCHEPRIAWEILLQMLAGKDVQVLLECVPRSASMNGDKVESVQFQRGDEEFWIDASYVLDATELGDLLPMTGTEFAVGTESQRETGERSAPPEADPDNQQAITWVFAMAHDAGSDRIIDRPEHYERWSAFQPSFWPGPLLGEWDVHPTTLEPRRLPFMGEFSWFTYRQIVEPANYLTHYGGDPVTIVNWPMNDYFLEPLVRSPEIAKAIPSPLVGEGRERGTRRSRNQKSPFHQCHDHPASLEATGALEDAKELSRCLLYWMQTDLGLTGLYMQGDTVGTSDGFAKYPYIRESRRIRARFTVLEQHVSTEDNPGRDRAVEFKDSVGIGAYRIDLHPSTGGDNYIDIGALPFQIPLGSLIPVTTRNLIPACKNIGVTHITNGCYRLHPVEWNIGEAAGLLAGFCLGRGCEPAQVYESEELLKDFQTLCDRQGIEREWPTLHGL